MNFEEAIQWLNGFQQFGMKLGLKRIGFLSKKLDNPQESYRVVHVGGTNGKGTVCKLIGNILVDAGFKVGIYTSPHLQRLSERIMINNVEISDDEFVSIIHRVKPFVDEMIKKSDTPTYFEIITIVAFEYFKNKKVDFAVTEVGLGGRFDATNIVSPVVSVITNVSLEHEKILGSKVEDIAFEKSGIIKKNIPVVTAVTGSALNVVKKISGKKNAPIAIVKNSSWNRTDHEIGSQTFTIKGSLKDYFVKTPMMGIYQGENIAIAVLTIEILQMNGTYIPDGCIANGVSKTVNSGRVEIVSLNPILLLDGAHNVSGIKFLKQVLENDLSYKRSILVLGILSDKNIQQMIDIIVPLVDIVIVTKSHNDRACDPLVLKNMIPKKDVVVKKEIPKAVDYAKSIANKNDLICVTGSLFTVGEARQHLNLL